MLGIPKTLAESDFFTLFENLFGNVSHAYIKQNNKKAKYLGFVTFKDEATANLCIKTRIVRLSKSETLSIKKFTAKTKTGANYPFFSQPEKLLSILDLQAKNPNQNEANLRN